MSNNAMIRLVAVSVMALAYVLLAIKLGVLFIWLDKRVGALLEDRVGPSCASVKLSGRRAAAMTLTAAVTSAVLILYVAREVEPSAERRGLVAFLVSQLALFATWFSAVLIAGRLRSRRPQNAFELFVKGLGSPRRMVGWGLLAQAFLAIAAVVTRGQPLGLFLEEIGHRSAPAVLSFVIVGGAIYEASGLVRSPTVELKFMGLLHPLADAIKWTAKEDVVPWGVDGVVHALAPVLTLFAALLSLSVVPLGDTLCFGEAWGAETLWGPLRGACSGENLEFPLVNSDVGVLLWFALSTVASLGPLFAGWASNSKLGLLGGLRATSQSISYWIVMGLALVCMVMIEGSLRLDEMVLWQSRNTWGIFVQPFAFLLFFVTMVMALRRVPFHVADSETELGASYFTEYSGRKLSVFVLGEYVSMVVLATVTVTIFLGGHALPFVERAGLHVAAGDAVLLDVKLPHLVVFLIGLAAFLGKTVGVCWLSVLLRGTSVKPRTDQVMSLGFRKLLPWALLNVLVTMVVVMLLSNLPQASTVKVLATLAVLANWLILLGFAMGSVALVLWLKRSHGDNPGRVPVTPQPARDSTNSAAGGTAS